MARLLLVEDDSDTRNLVSLVLARAGHRVIPVPGPEEARDVVSSVAPPDGYILDLGLPGMDGADLLRQLRLMVEDPVPALFISARARASDVAHGLQVADGYVTKPFHVRTLLDAVDAMLSPSRDAALPDGPRPPSPN
jgi:two-component system OmpR family response regulator